MYTTTSGIVIKTTKFSDSDVLLTIFTEKFGKIAAVAKGGKNAKSKLNSGSQLFVYGEYSLSMDKTWNYVNSVDVYKSFYKIREDLDALTYGSYILELLNYSVEDGTKNMKIFGLLLKVITLLSEDLCNKNLLKAIFEVKLLNELGYSPELENCTVCGKGDSLNHFSIADGGVICENCSRENDRGIKVNSKIPRLINFILQSDKKKICESKINDFYIDKLDILLSSYLKYHIGIKNFKSIEFLNMLRKYEE